MKNTQSGLQMDPVSTFKRNNRSITLRSTPKIYNKWGLKYQAAVRDAVFGIHSIPFVPLEPPPSLKCNSGQSDLVYVCQQCKDCFWFKSSFEHHSQRHSWILGFWCQKCFLTVCTHVPNDNSQCDDCIKIERERRVYMRKRGVEKKKMGAIRIFYNQCQFFAHLQLHNISLVNMCDIMLMPLPNMEGDWTSEMDIACEALLEYCFMIKVHIMDWLRTKKVDHNWWQLIKSNTDEDDNPVRKILRTYNGRYLFGSDVAKVGADLVPLNLLYTTNLKSTNIGLNKMTSLRSEKDNDKNISNTSIVTKSSLPNQDTMENEDNPCTPTDITFVDCGPTHKYYICDTPTDCSVQNSKVTHSKYVQYMDNNMQLSACKKQSKQKKLKKESVNYITTISSSADVISIKGFSNQNMEKDSTYIRKGCTHKCNNNNGKLSAIAITTQNGIVGNTVEKSISKNSNLLPNLSHKSIVSQEYLKQKHSSVTKIDSNLSAFQGTDSAKISTLITQMPCHLLSNNKILFIGQDSDGINKRINRITVDGKSYEKDKKSVSTKLIPLRMCNSTISEDNKSIGNMKKVVAESNKAKVHQIPIEGKVVYQNGRRYIITHTSNGVKSQLSTPTSPNSPSRIPVVQCNTQNQNGEVTESNSFENAQNFNLPKINISLPTPSPSSSELSNISSCEAQKKQISSFGSSIQKVSSTSRNHVKPNFKHSIFDLLNDDVLCETLSFHRADNEELYLNIKRSKSSTKQLNVVTTVTIPKCRQDMLNELRQLSSSELKERILHLQDVRSEILRVMNFLADKDIENTLKSIRVLERTLEDALESCNHESEDKKDVWNDQEVSLNDWESELQLSGDEFKCGTCSKIMKPKSYIPGFSKPAENDSIYCSCYKHFCHECCSYQGNVTRFLTHQNFHEEERPYACPDCYHRFPSFRLLEGHTWSLCFHMLKKRFFCCKICQIDGFQDTESITRHFAIMHSSKKIACEVCYMVLDTYSEYKGHRDKTHSTVRIFEPIRLIICKLGQCINRREKYMTHVEKHYGIRKTVWLKCPFCPYYNAESKQFLMQFKIHFQIIHLNRLSEIIKPETLKDILPSSLSDCLFKDKDSAVDDDERSERPRHSDDKECLDDTVIPKIINTRTIPSEDFERVSGAIGNATTNCKSLSSTKASSKTRVILDIRSKNTDSPVVHRGIHKEDNLPKILEVRSMADASSEYQKSSSNINHTEEVIANSKDIQLNATIDKMKKIESLAQDESKSRESSTLTEICVAENIGGATSTSLESNLAVINSNDTSNEIETRNTINTQVVTRSEQATTASSSNSCDIGINKNMNLIPKPPPLARIPQYLLESSNDQKAKEIKKKNRTVTHISGNRKTCSKRLWRIALNGPTNSKDEHQNYLCHLCGELINTSWPVISNHFSSKHSNECKLCIVTPRLLRITPEFIDHGYKELFSSRKRRSDEILPMLKKRRRWTTKKHTDSSNSIGLGLCVERESAEDGEGNFICRKCDQRCTNMSNLREHIATNHRIKGRYLVCLECGENFVVAPSLQMHLKAFHGIEDPISYMNQNSSYAARNIDDLENETKATIANQCYVCMAVFEDKATVDKHLRVHGMAFLNLKRIEAQNALKSSEKNGKINENKQSPEKESTKDSVKRDNPSNTILEKINATILEESQ